MLTFHVIPNAHIDPVWLWDKAEGMNQAVRTFRSVAAAGMEYFAFTRPFPATLPTPKPAFWWRGPSGARVLCYRPEVGWYGMRQPSAAGTTALL